MKNIMKAQLFQILREKILWYTLVLCFLMQAVMFLLPVWLKTEKVTSAGEFFATNAGGMLFFPLIFMIIITGQICGGDFLDKTHHYELLSGHKRGEVYLGRVIPAMLIAGIGGALLTYVPVVLYGLLYGWGNKIAWGAVVFRMGMLLFPILRMVCEYAFLTFLVKNPYIMMGLGYGALMAALYLGELMKSYNAFLGIINMIWLLEVEKWITFGLGGDLNYIYEAALNGREIFQTILASLVFGGAALYLGYVYFKNNDLN